MGDVQSIVHQVRVPEEDRDLLRFLCWPKVPDMGFSRSLVQSTIRSAWQAFCSPSKASPSGLMQKRPRLG